MASLKWRGETIVGTKSEYLSEQVGRTFGGGGTGRSKEGGERRMERVSDPQSERERGRWRQRKREMEAALRLAARRLYVASPIFSLSDSWPEVSPPQPAPPLPLTSQRSPEATAAASARSRQPS